MNLTFEELRWKNMQRTEGCYHPISSWSETDWMCAAMGELGEAAPEVPLIASGGLETGIDVAKCIALGANLAALAWPLLRASLRSSQAVIGTLEPIIQVLRVAMFCIGAPNVAALQGTAHLEESRL